MDNANPFTHRTVTTKSVRWHLIDTDFKNSSAEQSNESGTNEADLYLHGTGSSSHSWLPLIQHAAKPRRTLLLDLPGHAKSQLMCPPVRWPMNPMTSPLSLNAMTRSIEELIDSLGVKIHTLVGHSAGAAIACKLCLNNPNVAQHIVSINGALVPLDGIPGLLFSPIAKFSAASDWAGRLFSKRLQDDQYIDRLLKNTGSTISPEQRSLYSDLCHDEQHVTSALRMMASWDLNTLYRQLPHLKVPTLWLSSDGDRMIPSKDAYALEKLVPGSKAILIKNTGHLAHEERPDLIAPIIDTGCTKHLERMPVSHNERMGSQTQEYSRG